MYFFKSTYFCSFCYVFLSSLCCIFCDQIFGLSFRVPYIFSGFVFWSVHITHPSLSSSSNDIPSLFVFIQWFDMYTDYRFLTFVLDVQYIYDLQHHSHLHISFTSITDMLIITGVLRPITSHCQLSAVAHVFY